MDELFSRVLLSFEICLSRSGQVNFLKNLDHKKVVIHWLEAILF